VLEGSSAAVISLHKERRIILFYIFSQIFKNICRVQKISKVASNPRLKKTVGANRHHKQRLVCYSAQPPFPKVIATVTLCRVAVPTVVSNGGRDNLSLKNHNFFG
jgi:hypothetical protein